MPDKKARCNGFDVILQTNLFDKKENLAFVWNAAEFGTFLLNSVVMHMTQMQSSEVRYRKVKVLINQGIVWDSQNGFSKDESKRYLYAKHLYKCGSALVGTLEAGAHVSDRALSYLMYGRGLSSEYDKPSRFIVLGTNFQSNSDILASTDAAAI